MQFYACEPYKCSAVFQMINEGLNKEGKENFSVRDIRHVWKVCDAENRYGFILYSALI